MRVLDSRRVHGTHRALEPTPPIVDAQRDDL